MMSPQTSFAYNYGYGFSPTRRNGSQAKLLNTSISEEEIDALHGLPEASHINSENKTPPSLVKHEIEEGGWSHEDISLIISERNIDYTYTPSFFIIYFI